MDLGYGRYVPTGTLRRLSRRAAAPVVAIALLGITLSGCVPAAEGPSQLTIESEITARTLMSLLGSADSETVADLFYPDAVYDDFPNQTQYRGIEEIAGYVNHVHDWASGVDIGVLAVHASETSATVEWVFSGIQDQPIGSRVPVATGREVVLNGVTILEMDNGRIRRAADYLDGLSLVLQLGSEVRLPGGSIMKLDLPGTTPDLGPDPGADPGADSGGGEEPHQ